MRPRVRHVCFGPFDVRACLQRTPTPLASSATRLHERHPQAKFRATRFVSSLVEDPQREPRGPDDHHRFRQLRIFHGRQRARDPLLGAAQREGRRAARDLPQGAPEVARRSAVPALWWPRPPRTHPAATLQRVALPEPLWRCSPHRDPASKARKGYRPVALPSSYLAICEAFVQRERDPDRGRYFILEGTRLVGEPRRRDRDARYLVAIRASLPGVAGAGNPQRGPGEGTVLAQKVRVQTGERPNPPTDVAAVAQR
mmetsp:Transcript_33194/g.91500  ORF Transcript_33194/g.91500 Transcript_33194/m.91500 type:complete len:256 (-) Transcript_33194:1320-2087(-)